MSWLLPLSLLAQSQWFARSWQSEDGLPNNTVSSLAQTPDGYLWLGTPSELVRFDGVSFEVFPPVQYIAPPNRGVMCMLLARDGALWLGLDRGAVVCLQGSASTNFITGLPTTIPQVLAEDAAGAVWIAYSQGELFRVAGGKPESFQGREGFPPGAEPYAVCSDTNGLIWACKRGQLGRIKAGQFELVAAFEPAAARLSPCRTGGVWLCLGSRLFQVDSAGTVRTVGEFGPQRAGTQPSALLEDSFGAVWIGTTFSGVFRYDGSDFESVETPHQEILALTLDREGNLWVGTAGGGLNRLRRRSVEAAGTESGLPFAAVQSICEDADGGMWAATQNGLLAHRRAGKWESCSAQQGWPESVTCVAAAPDGAIWVGTRTRHLVCWRDGKFVDWGDPGQLRSQILHTILPSRSGDLWLGGERPNSVQRLRQGRLQNFELPPSDVRVIRAMAEDASGNIWAATSKGLLFRVEADRLVEATPRPATDLAPIRCLHATSDGALWIGYAGWGLGRLAAGSYGEVQAEQGLYDDYLSHIVEDGHGWLWFAADRGLFRARQAELERVARHEAGRVRSIHYGRGEGLPSLQGNFGGSPDVVRSRDGRLWIPMRTALAVVSPAQIAEPIQPPSPILRRVTVDGRAVASYAGVMPRPAGGIDLGSKNTGIVLAPRHSQLELDFSALTFATPESLHFRYRLEGLDEDWVEAGTRRTAHYSRLSAGHYRLHLGAATAEGEWTDMAAPLVILVRPFFWQAWWFRLSVLAAGGLGLATLVRYVSFRRLQRQLRALEAQAALYRERARIAKDIHDDVGAYLTQIVLVGELAYQDRADPEKAAGRIGNISRNAREAVRALDEIVWAVNPRNDTLAHFIEYAGQFALEFLRQAGIRCRLDFPEQTPAGELSTDLRHNLFLVVKEALNNIVKHAQATEVQLSASLSAGTLQFRLQDNGRGFTAAPDNSSADGLRNMRQRIADIGGQLDLVSRPGEGTTISIHLPLPPTFWH